jgi:hypothetical protein
MSSLEIRQIDNSEYGLWDDLIEKSPYGTIFHTSDWLTICKDVLKKDFKIYGCFQKDKLLGGCTIFVNKLLGIFKVATSSCDMTPYGGIVTGDFSNEKARKQIQDSFEIINSLCKFFNEQRFHSISINPAPSFYDIRPFTWNGWDSKVFYAYYIDLHNNIDKQISKDIKRDIKKARENRIITRKLNDPSIHYNLFSRVFQRQEKKCPVSLEFFIRVFELIEKKNIGYMLVAENSSSEIIASHIRLYDKKNICAWTAASNPEFRDSGANTLLYYNEIKELEKDNFEYMNMMAANTKRFTDFIAGFNPKLVPYFFVGFHSGIGKIVREMNDMIATRIK